MPVARLMLEIRFWGIFWIDASSKITANQGFLEISQICGVDKDPKVVRQWLSNTQNNWLLIIDNADDPSVDVSQFFPTGNRGSILLTTRNPDCKIHSTVGSCELGQMDKDETVTLLLKATGAENTADETLRKKAIPVTQTVGYLALAIIQAGAYMRQGFCEIEQYCDEYIRCRQSLLEYVPVQQSFDYEYSVYTTWEISIAAIEKMCSDTSRNAIELLRVFCFLHFDGIPEEIFELAQRSYWSGKVSQDLAHMFYMEPQQKSKGWDSVLFRKAAVLLASFSLIKIDGIGRCMSMHPLVHVWARDRLSDDLQRCFWVTSSSTLAATITREFLYTHHRFRRSLLPHIKSCISLCKEKPFLSKYSGINRGYMAAGFAAVFLEFGLLQEAMELREKVLEVSQRVLGSKHSDTLWVMNDLAVSYHSLGRMQEAMELQEKVLEASPGAMESEHPSTLRVMNNLACSYISVGRGQEAMELQEKIMEASQKTLGSEHPDILLIKHNLAHSYGELGRRKQAMELQEEVLEVSKRTLGTKHPHTLMAMHNLAASYSNLECHKEAMELQEIVLEARKRILGSEYPTTLNTMSNLALSYSNLGRMQEAIELQEKLLEASWRTLGSEHYDTLRALHNFANMKQREVSDT